jgi:hypothetical protein
MTTPKLDAKAFEWWIAAPAVFEQLGDLGSRIVGINALADRLRAGLARAGAAQRTLHLRAAENGPIEIPQSHWPDEGMHDNELWQTGQLMIFKRQRSSPYTRERYDYYGVRFDPVGLDALWAAAGKHRVPESPQPAETEPAPVDERPTVSATDLAKWLATFTVIYPDWTVEEAVKSAVGMFPRHKVPRKMVRDLVGRRPRGRPTGR